MCKIKHSKARKSYNWISYTPANYRFVYVFFEDPLLYSVIRVQLLWVEIMMVQYMHHHLSHLCCRLCCSGCFQDREFKTGKGFTLIQLNALPKTIISYCFWYCSRGILYKWLQYFLVGTVIAYSVFLIIKVKLWGLISTSIERLQLHLFWVETALWRWTVS